MIPILLFENITNLLPRAPCTFLSDFSRAWCNAESRLKLGGGRKHRGQSPFDTFFLCSLLCPVGKGPSSSRKIHLLHLMPKGTLLSPMRHPPYFSADVAWADPHLDCPAESHAPRARLPSQASIGGAGKGAWEGFAGAVDPHPGASKDPHHEWAKKKKWEGEVLHNKLERFRCQITLMAVFWAGRILFRHPRNVFTKTLVNTSFFLVKIDEHKKTNTYVEKKSHFAEKKKKNRKNVWGEGKNCSFVDVTANSFSKLFFLGTSNFFWVTINEHRFYSWRTHDT